MNRSRRLGANRAALTKKHSRDEEIPISTCLEVTLRSVDSPRENRNRLTSPRKRGVNDKQKTRILDLFCSKFNKQIYSGRKAQFTSLHVLVFINLTLTVACHNQPTTIYIQGIEFHIC